MQIENGLIIVKLGAVCSWVLNFDWSFKRCPAQQCWVNNDKVINGNFLELWAFSGSLMRNATEIKKNNV